MPDEPEKKSYLEDEDVQHMLAFQAGDGASFEILLKKYFPRSLNFIYKYTGNKEKAEDLTQEVFIRVYKTHRTYIPRSKFNTWLYVIARNISYNELRKDRHHTISLDEPIKGEEGHMQQAVRDKRNNRPDDAVLCQERAQAVRDAIQQLPEKQRTAVVLYRFDGLSYNEIATVMKLSEKAVKSLLHRAREKIRHILLPFIKDEK